MITQPSLDGQYENYECLVINNTTSSNKLEDKQYIAFFGSNIIKLTLKMKNIKLMFQTISGNILIMKLKMMMLIIAMKILIQKCLKKLKDLYYATKINVKKFYR